MSDFLEFDPVISFIPLMGVISVVVMLTIFFVWKESRMPYRFKGLRVAAQVVAMLAFVGLLLRPSYSTTKPGTSLVLLTPNYSTKTFDSLIVANRSLRVVLAPGVAAREGAAAISSFRQLSTMGEVAFVLGDGIPTASLELLKSDPFIYLRGVIPAGIVSLDLGPFPENRKNFLRGEIRDGNKTRVRLVGPGGVEDSVLIRKNGLQTFQLAFTTKRPGQYVYSLMLTDSTGRKVEEQVPVEVIGARTLRILLLQTYPQAEVRFLKNYLGEKGHAVTTRYQLSRNVFRYEFANTSSIKPGSLTGAMLDEYDLVITDDESLDLLAASERSAIEQSVGQGLGLLMLIQQVPEVSRFPGKAFGLAQDSDVADTIRYSVPGYGNFVSPFTALRTLSGSSVQPVMLTGTRVLSGFVLHGQGKAAFQSLRETYRLALGGETGPYAALWTPLLEQVARREDIGVAARVLSSFPIYPDDPVSIEIIGSGPLTVSTQEGARIPLTEDVRIDDVWGGTFWSDEPGWSSLSISDGFGRSVFTSKPGDWKSLRISNQQRANARISSDSYSTDLRQLYQPVPQIIFFVLFLLSAGFVWLAPKL